MKQQTMWAVDVPNPQNLTREWINIDYFARRKDAIKYVCDNLGITARQAALFVSRVSE